MEKLSDNDPGKTVAIVSYITIIGLIIAFVMHNDEKNKSDLGAFHLRQAIGIFCTFFCFWIAQIFFAFIPFLGWLINIAIAFIIIGLVVLWIMGLISAINGEKKLVPFLGQIYQDLLSEIR